MMINKTRYNKEEQEQQDEEQYEIDEQYEKDRLTDDNAYSEYFEDDENKDDSSPMTIAKISRIN
jgi:hypothetical protein